MNKIKTKIIEDILEMDIKEAKQRIINYDLTYEDITQKLEKKTKGKGLKKLTFKYWDYAAGKVFQLDEWIYSAKDLLYNAFSSLLYEFHTNTIREYNRKNNKKFFKKISSWHLVRDPSKIIKMKGIDSDRKKVNITIKINPFGGWKLIAGNFTIWGNGFEELKKDLDDYYILEMKKVIKDE